MARRHADVRPFVPLVDSAEQLPYSLVGSRTVALHPWSDELGMMAPARPPDDPNSRDGDYSLEGGEHLIRIERKSLPDLVRCCGSDRERFERELRRLSAYPLAALLIEADLPTVAAHQYTGGVHPRAVIGSTIAWTVDLGIHVVWASDRLHAQAWTLRALERAHRRICGHHPSVSSTDHNTKKVWRPWPTPAERGLGPSSVS